MESEGEVEGDGDAQGACEGADQGFEFRVSRRKRTESLNFVT